MHQNLLMKYNDLPIETQSLYSALSSTNQKPKKLTNINISSGSSCSDTDSEFEYVLEKKQTNNIIVRGEDSDHEVLSNKPESESDTAETIEQHTRPKRNRRPKQLFRYDTLEIHHTT